jgi:hypothetical protein
MVIYGKGVTMEEYERLLAKAKEVLEEQGNVLVAMTYDMGDEHWEETRRALQNAGFLIDAQQGSRIHMSADAQDIVDSIERYIKWQTMEKVTIRAHVPNLGLPRVECRIDNPHVLRKKIKELSPNIEIIDITAESAMFVFYYEDFAEFQALDATWRPVWENSLVGVDRSGS